MVQLIKVAVAGNIASGGEGLQPQQLFLQEAMKHGVGWLSHHLARDGFLFEEGLYGTPDGGFAEGSGDKVCEGYGWCTALLLQPTAGENGAQNVEIPLQADEVCLEILLPLVAGQVEVVLEAALGAEAALC